MKKVLIFTALLALASFGFATNAKADTTSAGGWVRLRRGTGRRSGTGQPAGGRPLRPARGTRSREVGEAARREERGREVIRS